MSIYTYYTEWSDADEGHVGLCKEFPSLSWLASTEEEALNGIKKLVDDNVKDIESDGDYAPPCAVNQVINYGAPAGDRDSMAKRYLDPIDSTELTTGKLSGDPPFVLSKNVPVVFKYDTERLEEIRRSKYLSVDKDHASYEFTKETLIKVIKKIRRYKNLSRKAITSALGFNHKNEYVNFIRGKFDFSNDSVEEMAKLLVANYIDIVRKYIRVFITIKFTETLPKNVYESFHKWMEFMKEPTDPPPPTIIVDSLGHACA